MILRRLWTSGGRIAPQEHASTSGQCPFMSLSFTRSSIHLQQCSTSSGNKLRTYSATSTIANVDTPFLSDKKNASALSINAPHNTDSIRAGALLPTSPPDFMPLHKLRHLPHNVLTTFRAAGVLCYDFDKDGKLQVLLILESGRGGQCLCIPGGKRQGLEGPVDTASREAYEETNELIFDAFHTLKNRVRQAPSAYIPWARYVLFLFPIRRRWHLPQLFEDKLRAGKVHPEAKKTVRLQWVTLDYLEACEQGGAKQPVGAEDAAEQQQATFKSTPAEAASEEEEEVGECEEDLQDDFGDEATDNGDSASPNGTIANATLKRRSAASMSPAGLAGPAWYPFTRFTRTTMFRKGLVASVKLLATPPLIEMLKEMEAERQQLLSLQSQAAVEQGHQASRSHDVIQAGQPSGSDEGLAAGATAASTSTPAAAERSGAHAKSDIEVKMPQPRHAPWPSSPSAWCSPTIPASASLPAVEGKLMQPHGSYFVSTSSLALPAANSTHSVSPMTSAQQPQGTVVQVHLRPRNASAQSYPDSLMPSACRTSWQPHPTHLPL